MYLTVRPKMKEVRRRSSTKLVANAGNITPRMAFDRNHDFVTSS